jgi:hypothetical protein
MAGLGDIEAFFALKDRFNKWHRPEPLVTNTAQRFIYLFEAHGVARVQIPRFFGHNLTIYQVEHESELLKVLNAGLLDAAATLFSVRVEWLEGATEEIYQINHFYQQPYMFGTWLDSLLETAGEHNINGWLLTTQFKTDEYDALILMREKVGELAGQSVYRYHFCEQWIFSYWKCRADIAACVAQAWKRNSYVLGKRVNTDLFSRLLTLKLIPDSERDNTKIRGQPFHAEDLTIHPDFYTQGLAEGQFGKDYALGRWLEHYDRGLMGAGFGDCSLAFKHALKN